MRDHGGSSVARHFSRVGAEGGGRGMSELGLTAVPMIALVLTFGVFVILLLIIWSIKRHRDPDLHI